MKKRVIWKPYPEEDNAYHKKVSALLSSENLAKTRF